MMSLNFCAFDCVLVAFASDAPKKEMYCLRKSLNVTIN